MLMWVFRKFSEYEFAFLLAVPKIVHINVLTMTHQFYKNEKMYAKNKGYTTKLVW